VKRTFLLVILSCSLLVVNPAEAGKGRSFSSGGSSFKGSSGFGSRSASPSFPKGRSYSSGGSAGSRTSPWSRPPASRPATPSFDSRAAEAQRRQSSRSAYRGSPAAPPAPRGPAAGSSPQGRSYSAGPPAGPSRPAGKGYSMGQGGSGWTVKTPQGGTYDAGAAAAQRRQESRAAFTRGQTPRPTYTTQRGESRPLDPKDRRVEQVRREDPGRWWTREERRQRTYHYTPPPGPVVVYHDPYSDWFWYWLLAQDLQTRAAWAYNHRADMDEARYRDLLAHDRQLEARVRELESKKTPPEPTYVPPGVDGDLMYDDGFVEAAVNPQPAPTPPVPASSGRHLLGALVRIVVIVAVLAFLVWLVFIKRWGGTPSDGRSRT
jgi:hypothetical protein